MPKSCTRRSFVVASSLALSGAIVGGCAKGASSSGAEKKASAQDVDAADLVITNAIVRTMVDENDVAEAIAVAGNTIVYVGDTAGAEAYVGEETKVLDLEGGFVSPGFADGHLHMPAASLDEMFNCVLTEYSTNEGYVTALRKHVEANPDRDAYFGTNFALNVYQQPDGSNPGPDKADLDAICPDKPMIVYDVSHHSVWVNSKALELGGVTKDTPDPEGGFIYREADGSPHGCLTDTAASLIPISQQFTEEQLIAGCKDFIAKCNAYGLTAITDIDTIGPDAMRILHELEESGELTLRINCVPTCAVGTDPADTLDLIRDNQKYASEMLTSKTVKIFADGVTESGTAWMLEPYTEAAQMGDGWCAVPQWSDDDMNANVRLFNDAGIQVHIHAIGDAAVQQAVTAYENVANPKLRHTITHVCAITESDIQRMAKNDILAALQFVWMYRDSLAELEVAYVGEERAMAFYPTRKMADVGIRISGASDGPVTSFNPLEEMEAGVTRNSPFPGEEDTDMHRWPEQAFTQYEMLEAYTKNVAYQNFAEDLVGTIEVGKRADLVCLDTDIVSCDPKHMSDARVLFTISDGRIAYEG
ncbi:amidohydrolase [Denitrobacterium detoxificans]|uniref:amidohydrolase n=1 Tax=Denitrobacterium detoxificans TaxID=79604 RepID=UPI0026F0AA0E|nr:amidohydrolase [Denitrobacterium detoxificans]MBE6466809.1 amidohydrolase [Denitrobacterium detoxificans]